ncbi:MAG: nucleotidyltransferase domain-containing protein [Acidimicrobiia bacterium]|jgi:predicted nucleotidyltransferase/DNA-binding XRE family transcriptional regulator|nr:nucleotidyltransferase domain-containing protein [Acidimicrobiia bacterium]
MASASGAVLRDARTGARLSQTDVARRSGIAQSVISAYETGRREPGMQTLARLVEATGHQLVLDVVPATGRALGLPDSPLGRRLRRRRKGIIEAAEKRRAHNVRVFGSVARGEDTARSDVDLLVDLKKGVGLLDLVGLERELSELLGVHVDVVPADTLKPRIRTRVLAEAIPL